MHSQSPGLAFWPRRLQPTLRDAVVAAAAALATGVTLAAVQPGPPARLPSSVWAWDDLRAVHTPVGSRRAVFDSPCVTLDRLECHVTTVAAGKAPHDPHRHLEEELIFVKEGTLEVMQNGQTRTVGPGAVVFEASNDLHGLKNVGDTPASYFVLKWWPKGLAELAR